MPDYPLGHQIPDTPHAMCVSLPDMHAVIGYEEKDPKVMEAVQSGYPRFVTHRYILRLVEHFREKLDAGDSEIFLVNSVKALTELSRYVEWNQSSTGSLYGIYYYVCPKDPELKRRAFQLMQHTGYGLSSRQAEDILIKLEILSEAQRFAEERDNEQPAEKVKQAVAEMSGASPSSILLANSGMNAFYAGFKAAEAMQFRNGKDVWIQLGWLYLDTNKVLERLSSPNTRFITIYDVDARDSLEAVFTKYGTRVAGIITEAPTNPLVQTVDVEYLRRACDSLGALLVVDPTISSLSNVDVSRYADIVVTSLTKYAASEGDVIMGALMPGIERDWTEFWLVDAYEYIDKPTVPDCARMAAQIGNWKSVSQSINVNTQALATFLENHKEIAEVYWAESTAFANRFEKIKKADGGPGSIIAIYLKRPECMDAFYAALPIAKGPSFGTTFTLCCPFMYLAHYDLVSNEEGRNFVWDHDIDPDLIRISVGTESSEEIIAAFDRALAAIG